MIPINQNSGFTSQETQYVKLNLEKISTTLSELNESVNDLADMVENLESEVSIRLSHWHSHSTGSAGSETPVTIVFEKPVFSVMVKFSATNCTSLAINGEDGFVIPYQNGVDVCGNFGIIAYYHDTSGHFQTPYAIQFLNDISEIQFTVSDTTDYEILIID